MKKLFTCFILLLTVLTGTGLAQDSNTLGIFAMPDGYGRVFSYYYPGPFDVFVVLQNPMFSHLSGFEFGYDIVLTPGSENSLFRLGNVLPTNSIDLGDNTNLLSGDYVVGIAEPLPSAQNMVLVTWTFLTTDPISGSMFLGPSRIQSIDDGYPALEIGGEIIPADVVDGLGAVQACFGLHCIVAESDVSFGSVKALYR